jgi:hypothetical protein
MLTSRFPSVWRRHTTASSSLLIHIDWWNQKMNGSGGSYVSSLDWRGNPLVVFTGREEEQHGNGKYNNY